MDLLDNPWPPTSYNIDMDRVITHIESNGVFVIGARHRILALIMKDDAAIVGEARREIGRAIALGLPDVLLSRAGAPALRGATLLADALPPGGRRYAVAAFAIADRLGSARALHVSIALILAATIQGCVYYFPAQHELQLPWATALLMSAALLTGMAWTAGQFGNPARRESFSKILRASASLPSIVAAALLVGAALDLAFVLPELGRWAAFGAVAAVGLLVFLSRVMRPTLTRLPNRAKTRTSSTRQTAPNSRAMEPTAIRTARSMAVRSLLRPDERQLAVVLVAVEVALSQRGRGR